MTDGGDWFDGDEAEPEHGVTRPGADRGLRQPSKNRAAEDGAPAPAAGGSAAAGSVFGSSRSRSRSSPASRSRSRAR